MSDAPIVYTDDNNNVYYRASALGSCLRALWAARTGHTPSSPPKTLQAAFDKGHELEPVILKLLEDEGWTLTDPQKEIVFHVGTNGHSQQLYVVGHVDSLGTPPGGRHHIPVDAKSFAQSTLDDFLGNGIESFPHYSWQQSAYAVGLGVDSFCLPLYNKDTGELTIKVYDSLPHSYEDIQSRIFQVEEFTEMPTECDNRWGCPFSYLHDTPEAATLTPQQQKMATTALQIKRRQDILDKARKAILTGLQDDLTYTDTRRTFTGDGVTVSIVKNPKRFDQQKAKEVLTDKGEDINDYYVDGNGESIRVKEKP